MKYITKQKVLKGDRLYYFLPVENIKRLRDAYQKYSWKFPSIEFHENYVVTPYIQNTTFVKFKSLIFILKNLIFGTCFFDDLPNNIRGVLIDYEDLDVIPRSMYLLRLFEIPLLYRIPFFRKYYTKMYTQGYKIIQTNPIVMYKHREIFVLNERFERESGYNENNTNQNIRGKYYHLIEKYKHYALENP